METLTRSNGSSGSVAVDQVLAQKAAEARDPEMAAARRKLTAAIELLNSFDPSAAALEAAAIAITKVAYKAINPRKSSADEDA